MTNSALPIWGNIDLNKNELLQARFENRSGAPSSPALGQVYYDSTLVGFYGWNGTTWVNISQIVTNPITLKGEISNANTNPAYPSSPTIGDSYFITTNAGTVGGTTVEIGDQLTYSTSGWFVVQVNLVAATNALAGFIRIATQSEARAGSLDTVALTPARLADYISYYLIPKKVKISIATLTGGSPYTCTHSLGLAASTDCTVSCWQGGYQVYLTVVPVDGNSLTVQSNQTLSNVVVIITG